MQESVDINTINDLKELKSMAYDTLAGIERLQQNLKLINNRIAQVVDEPEDDGKSQDKKKD